MERGDPPWRVPIPEQNPVETPQEAICVTNPPATSGPVRFLNQN